MKKSEIFFIVLLSTIIFLDSCVSNKKLLYLRYSRNSDDYLISIGDIGRLTTPEEYKIMPYDNLYIRVLTPDPQWSSLFNMDVGSSGVSLESASLSGYLVDSFGRIEIPYVGRIEVGGKTLSQVKVELESVFKSYVTDAAITVKLVNNYISLIGEVRIPGRYLITKERLNVFEALSLAGDLSDYSDRQRLQLIRQSPEGPIIKEFSLSDRSILASEFYFIMPNDIIYAIPMKSKSFQLNSSIWTLFLTTITSALGVIAFFRTF